MRLPVRRGPTALLCALAALTLASGVAGYAAGAVPLARHLPGAVFCLWILSICSHDAIHGAAHGDRRINNAVGWIATFLMGGPFWLYRRAHLQHHARADRPDDPERYVYDAGWRLPFRLPTALLGYYGLFPRLPRREKLACAAVLALMAAAVVAAPMALGLGWILPMLIAAGVFALHTVWMPHGALRGAIMRFAPALTGYHDDHHAKPTYPFHQYPDLRASRREKREPAPQPAALQQAA